MKRHLILVVDDIPDNIDIICNFLSPEYDLLVANNGERALSIASSSPQPELILLDIMMPKMDGYEVCRRLKDNLMTAKIPIIFVTAKGETVSERIGFELGAVDYIKKPINPVTLLARVKTHIELFNEKLKLQSKATRLSEDQDSQAYRHGDPDGDVQD